MHLKLRSPTGRIFLLASASALLLAAPGRAQDASAAAPAAAPEPSLADATGDVEGTILVTARKRAESLIEVPLSIQAFSSADLANSRVQGLQELSRFTPSLAFVNGSQGQGGRALSEVRFRGLSTNVPTPTNQTGSVFIDGIYLLGGAQSVGFEDIERVEVIKGPQSAYFGRATFAGAVNYITRDPADSLSGQFSASYSPSFGSYALSGSVEGPLAGDTVTARLSASAKEKGAQYTASDGGRLGEEHTDAVNLTLLIKPTDALRIKLRGSYIEDNDGPAASGYFSYTPNGNCPIGTPVTVQTQAGEQTRAFATRFQCGNIPFNASLVDVNTAFVTLPASGTLQAVNIRDVLVGNSLNDPLLADAPKLERFGLTRRMVRVAGQFDYDISDTFALEGAAGYNKQDANVIRDVDGTPSPTSYQAVPYSFKDSSFEARLRYDSDSWLSGSVGINHFRQDIRADTDNGVTVNNQSVVNGTIIRAVTSSANNENDKIRTTGLFFGVDVDPVEWLTLTAEGRYQIDDYTKFGGNNATGNLVANKLRSKNFTPRAIVSIHPTRNTNLYGSYSVGVLPGTANTNFLALNATQRASVEAAFPDLPIEIDSEKLTNYEVGLKHAWPDLGLSFSLAAFHMKWKNIKANTSITVPTLPNPIFTLTVPGTARIRGVEFEGNLRATDQLRFRASAGYLDSKYLNYANRAYNAFFGIPSSNVFKADGKSLPRTPKSSASASATWEDDLTGDWSYRLRGDVLYTGEQYTDETNITSLAAFTTVNASAGIERDAVSVELYVNNLFNKRAWLTGRRFVDVSAIPTNFATAGQGSFVIPIDKREAGLTVRYRF